MEANRPERGAVCAHSPAPAVRFAPLATRLFLALVLWVFSAGGQLSLAWAQAAPSFYGSRGDFDPGSSAWNGLSELVAEARALGLEVETPHLWDWREARPTVPLLIVAPVNDNLDTSQLRRFVQDGGRVFLAEDFGSGLLLMESFGLRWYRVGINRRSWKLSRYIDIHQTQALPQRQTDFLLRQADRLFLNVPQWLFAGPKLWRRYSAQALLRAKPYRSNLPDRLIGGKVLYRLRAGWGVLLVFSDPSMLINQMLPFGDNRRFVRNTLRYLALPSRSPRVILLSGRFQWRGRYQPQHRPLRRLGLQFWEQTVRLNSALTSLTALRTAYPPVQPLSATPLVTSPPAPPASSVAMGLKILQILLILLLAIVSAMWLLGYGPHQWIYLENNRYYGDKPDPSTRFGDQVESYRDESHSFLWPLILLKEEVFAFLADRFHLSERIEGEDPRQRTGQVLELLTADANEGVLPQQLVRILPLLRKLVNEIPSRREWKMMTEKAVGSHYLEYYYDIATKCLRVLDLEEEFKNRRG